MSRSLAVLVMCWLLCQLHNPADISLWYWREDDEIALPETKVKEITAARKCEILPKRLRWAGMNCCHEMRNWGFGSNFSAFVLRPFLLITLLVSAYVFPSLILPQTVNHSREVDDYLLSRDRSTKYIYILYILLFFQLLCCSNPTWPIRTKIRFFF